MEFHVSACHHPALRDHGSRRPPKKSAKPTPKRVTTPRPVKAAVPVQPVAAVLPQPVPGVHDFPVVGLGASAGGLEAFEQFFRHVAAGSGLAYVLVSHLDPSRESILTEIVQRTTSLPVLEATDQLRVAPNHVYVIPPNRDMTIFHGALQLGVPEMPRGQRMPIDAFFRSLAEDQGERAIGVVLSGTGSDGSLGLRAILGAGGVTFAQDPATAKYEGMPASAIRAGYVTHVLAVEKLPAALRTAAKTFLARPAVLSRPSAARGMTQILAALRARTGRDFSLYKKSTVVRRIERRMSQHDIEDMDVYARFIKEHPEEAQVLFKELLINVTSFFRDPEAFETLRKQILPELLGGKSEGWVFRVWVAGCATGEEAYSIAMLLREQMDEARAEIKVQIYATDLDEDAIAVARAGAFSPSIVQDVTPDRLRRFFVKEEAGYRIKKEIREMVVFAIQDVIKDPPFTRLDLLACRNLMIYLEPEAQERLLKSFHYAIRPGGVLFLSPSESTGHQSDLFKPIDRKWKLFRVVPSDASVRSAMASAPPWEAKGEGEPARKARAAHLADLTSLALAQSFAPPSVVTDPTGSILYVHGDTGKYLRPAPGHATLNVIDLARPELRAELRAAFRDAGQRGAPGVTRDVPIKVDGTLQTIELKIRPLGAKEGSDLLLVSFQGARPGERPTTARKAGAPRPSGQGQVKQLEHALASSKHLLRTTVEEQQASTEELKSMNEELQSTNEELQSTNEELETSKEELQSVNEELVTVNAELQAKIEQLAGMQNDMRNLLDNVNVGTLFLDVHLMIRRFTRDAVKVFRLVPSDVGRPLADIKSDLEDEGLLAGAQGVLDTLAPWEREVRTAGGTSYLLRIQPYRTLDNVIEGVVMTFTDITARVAAEAAVQEARKLAESIVDTVREPLVVLDGKMRITSASRTFYQYFQVAPDETVGRVIFELGNRQWDIPALRELLETVLARDEAFDGYVVEHDFPRIGRRRLVLNARRIVGKSGETRLILLAMEAAG
jgi:two-component system CheB/CheR fusion protein